MIKIKNNLLDNILRLYSKYSLIFYYTKIMSSNTLQHYADCIWCKSNNLVDIVKDYIVKFEDPIVMEKYHLKKEDLLWSIRFMLWNLEEDKQFYEILSIAIKDWTPEIMENILIFNYPITDRQKEELMNSAKNLAKKEGPEKEDYTKILELLEKHEFISK